MTNNVKRFISYLIYILAFGVIVIKADDFAQYLKHLYASTYNPTYQFVFISLFPILIGLLLVLPQFITVLKQKGTWKVDWIVLLVVGLPSLCTAMTPIIVLHANNWSGAAFVLALHPHLVTVAGILFGFTLITSFGKQESK